MSDLENQLAIDLGEGSDATEQEAETLGVSETPIDETEGVESQQEADDVDVANELEARKEASRKATLKGQVKSYQSKLDEGQIEFDQIPKYLQEHIKHEEVQDEPVDNIDSLVEKKLEEKLAKQNDEQTYKQKLQVVKESSLSRDDKARLIEKWEFYKSRGFLDGEALSEAMETVGLRQSNVAGSSKGATLPKTTSSRTVGSYKYSDIINLSQKEYEKIRRLEMEGKVRIIEG